MTRAGTGGTRSEGFAPGQFLPGTSYQIVRVVGEGAMGVVYECIKEPAGISCVVKVLRGHLSRDADHQRRFLAEARVTHQLRHPNIVQVFDYELLRTGNPFFAMELLTGHTLRDVLAERRALPPRVASTVMQQLLSALACAHEQEPPVVHRDVKPDNIFLHAPKNHEASVKLLDFGVATVSLRNTSMAGTWGYMAPEQILGQPVTPRADVYAAAAVLFEMLTGRLPHQSNNLDEMAQATLNATPPRLSELLPWVPSRVDDAVASALKKNAAERPESAAAFARALLELDQDQVEQRAGRSSARLVEGSAGASLTALVRAIDVARSNSSPGDFSPPMASHHAFPPLSSSVVPRSDPSRRKLIAGIVAGGMIGLGSGVLIWAIAVSRNTREPKEPSATAAAVAAGPAETSEPPSSASVATANSSAAPPLSPSTSSASNPSPSSTLPRDRSALGKGNSSARPAASTSKPSDRLEY